MRISDWSSDVCSSDLAAGDRVVGSGLRTAAEGAGVFPCGGGDFIVVDHAVAIEVIPATANGGAVQAGGVAERAQRRGVIGMGACHAAKGAGCQSAGVDVLILPDGVITIGIVCTAYCDRADPSGDGLSHCHRVEIGRASGREGGSQSV